MSDEYTPTTEDILRYFVAPPYKIEPQGEGEDFASYLSRVSIETMHSRMASEASARRWLAEHDRQVAEKARAEGFALGWFAVSVEHEEVRGDINPVNGEPLSNGKRLEDWDRA